MKILSLLLFFFTLSAGAQTAITVTVKEEETNAPLPFSTVSTNGVNYVTDIDGKVTLQNPGTVFTSSYTGYTPKKQTFKMACAFIRYCFLHK